MKDTINVQNIILSSISDAVIATDLSENVILMNASACNLTGYTIKYAQKKPLAKTFKIIDPQTKKSIQPFKTRKKIAILITKDKQEYYISLTTKSLKFNSGTSHGNMIIFQDINKSMTNEKRLLEAQKMAKLGYWDWNVITGDVTWSDEVYAIFGINPKKFKPHIKSILELSPWPEDHKRDQELIQKAIKSRQQGEYEQRFLKPDGTIGYYHSTFQGKYDKEGTLIAMEGVIWDISERKHAEEALRKSEKRFRLLAENANDIIYRMSIPDGIYEYVSPASKKLLGYSPEEFYKSPLLIRRIIHPNWYHYFEKKWNDIINGSISPTYEYQIIHKNGDTKWMYQRNVLHKDDKGTPVAMEGIITDITDRKQTEKDLIKAKEYAEAANKTKSQFLSNMSHELRTPLNSIIGYSELLNDNSLEIEEQLNYANIINKNGKNLLTIINDILDISKIEAGTIKFEEADFNLEELISQLFKTLAVIAHKKRLSLTYSFSKNMPKFFKGDINRIRQILLNLLSNAIKFTEKGRITLSAKVQNKKAQLICFSIKDTGIGIPVQKQKEIFTSFTQVDNSHTRKYGGTGLGLSIVKTLVEEMGGSIRLISKENSGSEFIFTLKLKTGRDQKDSKETINKNRLSLKNNTILIAEDNAENQKLTELMLEKFGCTVESVTNGKQVIDKIKSQKYDLILMDIQMPVLDGLEATKIIRKDIDKKIPIIALTAAAMKNDEDKCLEVGMNDYISKPFIANTLREKILKWI